MAEYTEREALKNAYLARHRGEPGGAYQLICEVPAADVREVVLCKDCKHCGTYENGRWLWCTISDSNRYVSEDFFCGDGERKESDN